MSTMVTQIIIIAALRLGLPSLFRMAADADQAVVDTELAARRIAVSQHASEVAAEEARTLHDTAINTLGAIANGGAGVRDEDQVRAQCARDVQLLMELRGATEVSREIRLQDIFTLPGLPIQRAGLGDESLTRLSAHLAEDAARALVGCVREAVTNATKHSGADSIAIEAAELPEALVISVRDAGRGFEQLPTTGLGIKNSILARAHNHGFTTTIESEQGAGVSVIISVPIHLTVTAPAVLLEAPSSDSSPELISRAGLLWAVGVTGVSFVLTITGGTNHYFALYPMIAIMIGLCLLTWRRIAHRLLTSHQLALIAGTIVVFLLSAAATQFGADGAVHWQVLAPTCGFIMLSSLEPRREMLWWCSSLWIATIIIVSTLLWPNKITAAQIVLIAGGIVLGFSWMWARFQEVVEHLIADSKRLRKKSFTAQLDEDLASAARASYRRWIDAGLDDSLALLNEIAQGTRSPYDPETQKDSSAEERYLRQLVQVSPQLVNLGHVMLPTLSYARQRGIEYVLRLGSVDVVNEKAAHQLAQEVFRCLSTASPMQQLVVSLFPAQDVLQLTLLGAHVGRPIINPARERFERLGDLELFEVTYDRDQVRAQ